ncbi:MAG: elongation factor G [Lentisphaeria bacterium]|nr:elongation factor G [Lentisphaeria bacterium]
MNEAIETIRNIGVIAHIDAGKTTTTENMLFFSGLTHRVGNIDDGNTVMDYLDEERERGITIIAAAAGFKWREALIHLIDTPGHIDFTAEVERSMRVIDGAVVVFSAVEGVEAQSEKVWRQAEHYGVPKIAFINKLDRLGGSFDRVFDEINDTFGDCAVAFQMPVGVESDFSGLIDLVTFELVQFSGDNHDVVERSPVPASLREEAESWRERLIETLANHDDDLAMLYLEGGDIPLKDVKAAARKLTIARHIVPVFTGSAKNRLGVQPLMDAVVDYLPSPAECPLIKATRVKDGADVVISPDPAEPFTGLIFKVAASTTADLLFMRTYSGVLKTGMKLVNSRTKATVNIKQILRLFAKSHETIESAGPGDIVGLIGLRDCGTGDSLCEHNRSVFLEAMSFPEPVISMALEARATKDKDKLADALKLLCREDPTLSLSRDEDTGQSLFAGMGELHLEINLKRLEKEFNVPVRVGEPRVAYRETFKSSDTISARFDRMVGENELTAGATIRFSALPRGDELFTVTSSVPSMAHVSKTILTAAETALAGALKTGGNHGYPLIYVAAEITDIQITPDKSTEGAVVGAVLMAVDQAISRLGTRVLEPVMHLEIMSPAESVGEISSYLQPRRAVIHQMTEQAGVTKISCEVPLAEMFGFGKSLPKLSGGRASFSMEPRGFQELPAALASKQFGLL